MGGTFIVLLRNNEKVDIDIVGATAYVAELGILRVVVVVVVVVVSLDTFESVTSIGIGTEKSTYKNCKT